MSTDRTPIDRAAEALESAHDEVVATAAGSARVALSAALTNDADPDWLARAADPEAFRVADERRGPGHERNRASQPGS